MIELLCSQEVAVSAAALLEEGGQGTVVRCYVTPLSFTTNIWKTWSLQITDCYCPYYGGPKFRGYILEANHLIPGT